MAELSDQEGGAGAEIGGAGRGQITRGLAVMMKLWGFVLNPWGRNRRALSKGTTGCDSPFLGLLPSVLYLVTDLLPKGSSPPPSPPPPPTDTALGL